MIKAPKFILYFILLLLSLHSISYAQELWQKITSLKTSNCSYLDINSNGYIFAAYNTSEIENGMVYLSIDEGISWSLISESGWNRITDIAINQNNSVFIGTYGTGLFRSTDNGISWVRLNVNNNFDYIESIANGGNGILYAGCGTKGGISMGIFYSTDNGNQWSLLSSANSYNYIYSLFVTSQGTLLATFQNSGIQRTTNNGITWDTVRTTPAKSFVQTPSGEIICTNLGWNDFGISRSTDDGQTWVQANNGLPDSSIVCITSNLTGELFAGHKFRNI